MSQDPIFETLDTEAAASRAADLLQQINGARTLARSSGDPSADKIGADAEHVAKDVIRLANAIEHGKAYGFAVVLYFDPSIPQGEVIERVSQLRLSSARPVSLHVDLTAKGSALPEPAPAASAAQPATPEAPRADADPRQLTSPALGGEPAPAAPAAPQPKRAEESSTPIDDFSPTDEQIAGFPWDPKWCRDNLPAFKEANKGGHAKRWITSFRAFLSSLPDADAHKRTAEGT